MRTAHQKRHLDVSPGNVLGDVSPANVCSLERSRTARPLLAWQIRLFKLFPYHNDDDESESSHLQDYHNEGDESESAPIQELKSQEGTIIRGKVKIKVTLILVPVDEIQDADGLENTVEEFITDSDYESSDTIDYDTNRNEMKTMR